MNDAISASGAADLAARFQATRGLTDRLCQPLATEDYVVQSMPDASPVKWHLAHTTWFFETFLLEPYCTQRAPFHPQFRVLFNSYYESVGAQHPRAERGLLTRPSVAEVQAYRRAVDAATLELIATRAGDSAEIAQRIELGLAHEQQHQELLLTDLQHAFSRNPLAPVYVARVAAAPAASAGVERVPPLRFASFSGGLEHIGHDGQGFAFDNEGPRHRVVLEPFELATRLVTAGEYSEFIADGGYERPELWLSDGWAFRQSQRVAAPLYWDPEPAARQRYSLHGLVPIALDQPVCHVSFYEADAFARWAGARLPTEAEWELAYRAQLVVGQFVEAGELVPRHTASGYGSTWVWTASPYVAYPGYRPQAGALGEYNGKFMCNQLVLRGGSCFSAQSHLRASYRNFFPPSARWQVTGIRLAR